MYMYLIYIYERGNCAQVFTLYKSWQTARIGRYVYTISLSLPPLLRLVVVVVKEQKRRLMRERKSAAAGLTLRKDQQTHTHTCTICVCVDLNTPFNISCVCRTRAKHGERARDATTLGVSGLHTYTRDSACRIREDVLLSDASALWVENFLRAVTSAFIIIEKKMLL